jgi:hypothetical protein
LTLVSEPRQGHEDRGLFGIPAGLYTHVKRWA